MSRETIAEKIMLLGIDAMDPGLTKKYMERGVMPNVEKLMQRGSCRSDLVLLGARRPSHHLVGQRSQRGLIQRRMASLALKNKGQSSMIWSMA